MAKELAVQHRTTISIEGLKLVGLIQEVTPSSQPLNYAQVNNGSQNLQHILVGRAIPEDLEIVSIVSSDIKVLAAWFKEADNYTLGKGAAPKSRNITISHFSANDTLIQQEVYRDCFPVSGQKDGIDLTNVEELVKCTFAFKVTSVEVI